MFSNLITKAGIFIFASFLICCKDKENPVLTAANLHISIRSKAGNNPIGKAFIFLNDSLYGETDSKGLFALDSISPRSYSLTCSVINFRDTTLQIVIATGKATQLYFSLSADTSYGKVFGEFQDIAIFRQKAVNRPELNTWDEQEVYDGITGATIYKIGYPDPIPARTVSLEDSVITVADAFGQYYMKMQCGTYLITGACEGYKSYSKIIKVLKDTKTYMNFYLEKNK
jgi:hypothetical protein